MVDKLLGDLERERVRREELEMEVDRLRLKLHQTQERVQSLEDILEHQRVLMKVQMCFICAICD